MRADGCEDLPKDLLGQLSGRIIIGDPGPVGRLRVCMAMVVGLSLSLRLLILQPRFGPYVTEEFHGARDSEGGVKGWRLWGSLAGSLSGRARCHSSLIWIK